MKTSVLTSGRGLQRRTYGSMPLVANRHITGCGSRQFTIESSPRRIRTIFVVAFSQIKNEPSSDPATTYWPLLYTHRQHAYLWQILSTGWLGYNDNFKIKSKCFDGYLVKLSVVKIVVFLNANSPEVSNFINLNHKFKLKHIHTHICLTAFFSRTIKGKPFWILLKQEMMGAVASAGPYANHLHHTSDR